jgi:uncharacterized small protein (DUF1192 family)
MGQTAGSVRPVLVDGPREAQAMAPIEVGPDQQEIRLAIDGTTFIWIRAEPIEGTGPVVQQYFRLISMSQFRDARVVARLDDEIDRLDAEVNRLDREIERLDAELADLSDEAPPS